MKRRELLAAGAASIAAPWVHAQSAAWPTRGPVRLICQYPPGGLVDTIARLMAPHLSQALSQTVLVENRPGAGGLIGTEYASRQPADGYSLLVSHASVHIYATATRRTMPFDPVGDFTHMAMLVEAPMLLLVNAKSPYQNLAQYIAAAKTKVLRYGSSGIGSANHLFGELLKIDGNAEQHDHVPYQGSAPAMQDLMGGQIDSVFDPVTTNVNQLKGGTLRALAVSTPKRSSALPDLPTVAEAGVPGYEFTGWWGVVVPARTPHAVISKLNGELVKILAQPDVRERLVREGADPASTTPEAFTAYMRSEVAKWSKVIKTANIKAE